MCGIAGLVGENITRELIARMTARLRHRGPDDEGLWEAPGIALGHRRLSIIDLSPAGHQPMTYGDATIVFNGEIYNYKALARDLPGPFVSASDTEVLLHLYARDGERCVERLQGMFAFAIWDARRRVLFAARDWLGIKPLYYREDAGRFAFASEAKALLEIDRPPVDRTALVDYFAYRYVPAPKSVYMGIRKLLPGHTLTFDGRTVATRRYWQPPTETLRRNADDAREELRSLLRDCVVSHTVADVPVGVFLSGGVDSTALVAQLDRPRTFSIGFDVGEHSELPYARSVAAHFRTEHHEEVVAAVDVDEALAALPGMYDEPFGDSSAWATHIVSRLARKHVKVALSGEGGDEVFSGYRWYTQWFEFDSAAHARWLARIFPPFSPPGYSLYRRGADEVERYSALVGLFTVPQLRALLSPDVLDADYDPLWNLRKHWRAELDPVKRLQWVDLNTWLPDDLLAKVDRASMAVGLEVRPPLLDHRLVEFALSLDPPLLRENGRGKIALRRVLEGGVPREVLERPKKGFSMPVRKWLADSPDRLRAAFGRLASAGIFRSSKVPRLEGEQAWAILVMDRWMQDGRAR